MNAPAPSHDARQDRPPLAARTLVVLGCQSIGLFVAGRLSAAPLGWALGLVLFGVGTLLCAWLWRSHPPSPSLPALAQALPDGLLCIDSQGRIVHANRAMERLAGAHPGGLAGRALAELIPIGQRARDPNKYAVLHQLLSPQAPTCATEHQLLRCDETLVVVEVAASRWAAGVQGEYTLLSVRDSSARKQHEDTLRRLACHDALTGLYNRRHFLAELDQALAAAARGGHRATLLYLDIDHFKQINDTHGHGVGDLLLIEASQRMRALLRQEDALARLGGDEFAILVSHVEAIETAVQIAGELLHSLGQPYRLGSLQLHASCSIGLAFFPQDAHDSDALLHCADLAMYQAKRAGRGRFARYEHHDKAPSGPAPRPLAPSTPMGQ
ncbi:MAG: diguanylate cyclase domain-containing protein [Rhodoferax sp.]